MDVGMLLADGLGRVRESVEEVLDGVGDALVWQLEPQTNTVAWLVWHLTRVQDDHVAEVAGVEQVWTADGWQQRFGLPLDIDDTGYGHMPDQVQAVSAHPELLLGYHRAVAERSIAWVQTLTADDLDRVVDRRWDPPVTLGVRLVSVINDDMQHVGQAAYVRGLAERVLSK
jgi:uncharacterized damage-inducible protein DinB